MGRFLAIILCKMGIIRNTRPRKSNVNAVYYEDLFYEAVYRVLGGSFMRTNPPIPLSANLSSASPRFTIAGPKWGFEIYHNGEGLSDRVSMYQPGGCMERWRKDNGLEAQITVLDFRLDGDVAKNPNCRLLQMDMMHWCEM